MLEPTHVQSTVIYERSYLFELHLTGKSLGLSADWFQSAPSATTAADNRIFQTELWFSQPINRLIVDVSCLSWMILPNSAALSRFEPDLAARLPKLNQAQRYTPRVTQAIARHLQEELPSINAIARELNISVRQLQRELKAEGTSFQKLLDANRQELALHYLKYSTTPIHNIAFLLGFSEPSAFNRAFKRWTGNTPRSYRLLSEL